MKKEIRRIKVNGKYLNIEIIFFKKEDEAIVKNLYNQWNKLNKGLKKVYSRGVNMSEGISESAFCLAFGKNYVRALKGSGSYDVLNLEKGIRIQIKASTIKEDLTSFGPKSVWDELYFLDFFKEGNFDGSFDIYKINNNDIYNQKVNEEESFKEQQSQGRRPRFSIKKEIIDKKGLKPIMEYKFK